MAMRKANTLCALAGLLGSLATGCGSSAPQPMPEQDGAVFAVCANDTRGEAYTAGMSKAGKDGLLTVQLMSSVPGPPIKGNNAWSITIKNNAGELVEGASIVVTPYMPDHSHGTSVRAVVTPMAEGGYSIAPLYLYMAGLWQTTLQIQSAAEGDKPAVSDSVMFAFCVQG
jgi:hypothetical protein